MLKTASLRLYGGYLIFVHYRFILSIRKIALQTAEPFDILAHRFTIAFARPLYPSYSAG